MVGEDSFTNMRFVGLVSKVGLVEILNVLHFTVKYCSVRNLLSKAFRRYHPSHNSTMEDPTLVLRGLSPSMLPKRNDTDANKNPFVYDLETPLKCDRLEELETARIHEPKNAK